MQLNAFLRSTRRRARSLERGQAVAEFAMIIPFVVMFTFFVIQASVIFSMIHQASFASFAAARHHRVAQNHQEQQVVDAVLRGRFWKMVGPTWQEDGDGGSIQVSLDNLNTHMAYWPRGTLGCKQMSTRPLRCTSPGLWKLPTHLGPNVYDYGQQQHPAMGRGTRTTGKMWTDNNIDDG